MKRIGTLFVMVALSGCVGHPEAMQTEDEPSYSFADGGTPQRKAGGGSCGYFSDQYDMSDQVDVERYRNGRSHSISTSFVQSHERPVVVTYRGGDVRCSGTLISDDLVLTAAHCNHEVGGSGDKVYFNHQWAWGDDPDDPPDGLRTWDPYPIVGIAYRKYEANENGDADIEVLRIGANAAGKKPGDNWPVASLRAQRPELGEWTAMIGHPHNRSVWVGSGYQQGKWKMVVQGAAMYQPASGPIYTDFYGGAGSSGSGVLNADGEVIGVNAGAYFWDYGSQSGCSSRSPLSAVYSEWKSSYPELGALIKPARESACFRNSPATSFTPGTTKGTFYKRTSGSGYGAYGITGCPYSWTVQVNGISGQKLYAKSEIVDAPTSSTACRALTHTTVIKGYKNNGWHPILTRRSTPEWDNGKCDGLTNGWTVDPSNGYTKLRIVTRVERDEPDDEYGPRLQRVRAGVIPR